MKEGREQRGRTRRRERRNGRWGSETVREEASKLETDRELEGQRSAKEREGKRKRKEAG